MGACVLPRKSPFSHFLCLGNCFPKLGWAITFSNVLSLNKDLSCSSFHPQLLCQFISTVTVPVGIAQFCHCRNLLRSDRPVLSFERVLRLGIDRFTLCPLFFPKRYGLLRLFIHRRVFWNMANGIQGPV